MKRWEHARLIVKLTGEKKFNRITLFGPEGPKDGQLLLSSILSAQKKETPLAKEPGEWWAMDRAIADLGSQGGRWSAFPNCPWGILPRIRNGISGSSGLAQTARSEAVGLSPVLPAANSSRHLLDQIPIWRMDQVPRDLRGRATEGGDETSKV